MRTGVVIESAIVIDLEDDVLFRYAAIARQRALNHVVQSYSCIQGYPCILAIDSTP